MGVGVFSWMNLLVLNNKMNILGPTIFCIVTVKVFLEIIRAMMIRHGRFDGIVTRILCF